MRKTIDGTPGGPACLDSLMPWSESASADIKLKPKAAEDAARMADNPISVDHPRRRGIAKNLSELSQPKRENSERFIILLACFDAHIHLHEASHFE